MNWKQFLKPTWKKIILWVILSLLLLIQYIIGPNTCLCEPPPCSIYYHVPWSCCPKCGTISPSEKFLSDYYYHLVFIGIVCMYLISCLTVSACKWKKLSRIERSSLVWIGITVGILLFLFRSSRYSF